jgi:N-acetylglucosaminyldiphosphoundecaprenol N-acetyl-beta-D-mannosaminyltransferase
MMGLKELCIVESKDGLRGIPDGKVLINTVNAHSFNTAQKDKLFAAALKNGDYLIPDGASILMACKWLKAKSQPKERIAGWDLFSFEMDRLERKSEERKVNGEKLRVMFMGSSEKVLSRIREKAAVDYPNLDVVTYSPPYKPEFSDEDNEAIIKAINDADPDLLWIGMTAPKQEKWTYSHWNELNIHCHVGTIGAVFDFYAGTAKRAPQWWQDHSLEWLYRLLKEPKRMWKRYVLGNPLFVWNIVKEKFCE